MVLPRKTRERDQEVSVILRFLAWQVTDPRTMSHSHCRSYLITSQTTTHYILVSLETLKTLKCSPALFAFLRCRPHFPPLL